MATEQEARDLPRSHDDIVLPHARRGRELRRCALVSVPLFASLKAAGTAHLYADTADLDELARLLATSAPDRIIAELDGNTANQPLVARVVDRYLADGDIERGAEELGRRRPDLGREERRAVLYAVVCGRIGNDIVAAFGSGREWEVSLQLAMGLCDDPDAAKRVGRSLRAMVPSAFVKVPFAPHAPACFLVARDLEREGIPVNFTSTFSARQAVAVALLADVTRTNVFMGRLNQGLEADLLGEHVDLEAQRWLRRLRIDPGVKTQLIVASMRDWRTFVRVAGCDVFTAPCDTYRAFLSQIEVGPSGVTSQLETSYEDRLGVSQRVRAALGAERIARLYRVEPEFLVFLRELRASREWASITDGDVLARRFEDAGFGDFFCAPSAAEWQQIRAAKLPDLSAPLTRTIALDTLYTLLADADFEHHQAVIDGKIERAALTPLRARA